MRVRVWLWPFTSTCVRVPPWCVAFAMAFATRYSYIHYFYYYYYY